MERPGEAFLRKSGSRNPGRSPPDCAVDARPAREAPASGLQPRKRTATKPALIQVIAASRIAVAGALELV